MPQYRRNFLPGGTFFFTLVTHQRAPIFNSLDAVEMLRQAVRQTRQHHPFKILASVVLPDHLHMIWELPPGDARFDRRWSSIKRNFTAAWLASGGEELSISTSRHNERRRGVWQPRYIEHTLQDEADLTRYIHYIHINPVRHGYVQEPTDWQYSSIHRFLRQQGLSGGEPFHPMPNDDEINIDLLEP